LKNKNNILPIANEKIFVCGPAANSLNLLNGAWTHTWQGIDTQWNTKGKQTILQALQKKTSIQTMYANVGSIDSFYQGSNYLMQASQADKIVICIGETPSTEIVGNINDLNISDAQIHLIEKLKTFGKPIILVCCFNRPRIISKVEPLVDAILYAYLPSDEGGRAIADCITGKVNPSGKLPYTYPRSVNNFTHYDHKAAEDLDVVP
jgi:beta-glucosidase